MIVKAVQNSTKRIVSSTVPCCSYTASDVGDPLPGLTAKAVDKIQPSTFGLSPGSVLDLLLGPLRSRGSAVPKEDPVKKSFLRVTAPSRTFLKKRTEDLLQNLVSAPAGFRRIDGLSDLKHHLLTYPKTRNYARKRRAIPILFNILDSCSASHTKKMVHQCLSLAGYVPSLKGPGINMLAIDGGGTRGLVALEVLESLENLCGGKKIQHYFDYIVGTSTGAILAALLGGLNLDISQCKSIYKKISTILFDQSRLRGTTSLFWTHAYYDTNAWASFLRQVMGEQTMLDSATIDASLPKLGFLSAVVNKPVMETFIFRNYNLPPSQPSVYSGSPKYKLWQAVQASGAAPGYFQECILDDRVHQDGGINANNPTAVGMHECKLLWPDAPFNCIISIGNGRNFPTTNHIPTEPEYSSLREKIFKVIDSASDTQQVHTILSDLLPIERYFRFNPHLTQKYSLDENRPEMLLAMQKDGWTYARKNLPMFQRAAKLLQLQKSSSQSWKDWLNLQFKHRLSPDE